METQEITLFVPPGAIEALNTATVLLEPEWKRWVPHRPSANRLRIHSAKGVKLFIKGEVGVWDVDTIDEEDIDAGYYRNVNVRRGRAILQPRLIERAPKTRDRTPFRRRRRSLLRTATRGVLLWSARALN